MKYFAYGSNMDSKRMLGRGIDYKDKVPAKMKDVRLVFNKLAAYNSGIGYANIQLQRGSSVEGILYSIKKNDIRKLDLYEGFPSHYEKWEVLVTLETNEIVRAITYIAEPKKTRRGLKPTKDYLNHLLAGKNYLSEEYYDKLKSVETAPEGQISLFNYKLENIKKTV